jgi:hypothetical protein
LPCWTSARPRALKEAGCAAIPIPEIRLVDSF